MKLSKICGLLFACMPVFAIAEVEQNIESALKKAVPQLEVVSVAETPVGGIYQVHDQSGQAIFVSSNGEYFFTGELYSTIGGRLENISEKERQAKRGELLQSIEASELITYKAKGEEKAQIKVFTDIDCGYCRKLHREIPKMNELGITVSYMSFPRAGVNSASYYKLTSVWCADDSLEAMNEAKKGRLDSKVNRNTGRLNDMASCKNPVAKQYRLGQQFGVTGTPAIVLEDGTLIPGYMPAKQFAERLGI